MECSGDFSGDTGDTDSSCSVAGEAFHLKTTTSWLWFVLLGSVITVCLLCLVYYWCVLRYHVFNSITSLKGKTIIITGASSGIGKATAFDLARRGARLILACRNEQKTRDVMEDIRRAVKNAEVVYRHLDLAHLQSVRDFAQQIIREESHIDILINNAGIGQEGKTYDGFDLSFGVNHFGPFLLTNLLLDLLKRSAPSRIINLSSLAHKFSPKFNFTETEGASPLRYPHLASYPISKMAVNLFTHELARRLADSEVTVCSVHPGIVYTGAIDNALHRRSYGKLFIPFFRLVMRTPEAGAQCVLHCAIDKSVKDFSGSYFVDCQPASEGVQATDQSLAKHLWEVSCQATGL